MASKKIYTYDVYENRTDLLWNKTNYTEINLHLFEKKQKNHYHSSKQRLSHNYGIVEWFVCFPLKPGIL